jgi:hypothetical protein
MTLVNRMLKRAPETVDDLLTDEMVTWSDNANTDAWYYLAVQEATNSHIPERKEGQIVPGLNFEYEHWVENHNSAQLEKTLSSSDSKLSFAHTAYLQNSAHNKLQRAIPMPLREYKAAWHGLMF